MRLVNRQLGSILFDDVEQVQLMGIHDGMLDRNGLLRCIYLCLVVFQLLHTDGFLHQEGRISRVVSLLHHGQ